jgi:hypothetical protein
MPELILPCYRCGVSSRSGICSECWQRMVVNVREREDASWTWPAWLELEYRNFAAMLDMEGSR